MTIDGKAVRATERGQVINPATAEIFARVPEASEAAVHAAVAAAKRAFPGWSAMALDERRRLVMALGERVTAHADELAALLTHEQGKPLAKSKSEVAAAVAYLNAYASLDVDEPVLRDTAAQYVQLRRRPLGVVGAITAWNYPILLALWKIAPAIVAGNTVVVKPSPFTPVATLRLGELTRDVLPAGVVNIVSGGGEVGQRLVAHPDVRKIAFTGSAATGRRIMAAAAGSLKRLTLELGGNDAGIVLNGVDPAKIASDLFWAKFSNCGQVCASLKRLYVHEAVFDAVCGALAEVAARVKVGEGFDPTSEVGPLQNRMQFDKVKAAHDEALAKGAHTLFRGRAPEGPGYFFPITLLTEAHPGMKLVDEELFGPVLPIMAFRDEDEVLVRANGTEYGLGGSIWSADPARAAALAAQLEVGSAWVNQHPSMGPDIPFGGVKQSGIGVECGRWGLEEYTAIQVTNVKMN
jgi:acyl-CoA reductase-like NAD-dependent aldehyde dehydrogenase